MKKKVSVIVPCYNVEKYIERCVASLVGQTIGIENLELIFVDDASTDNTVECLKIWENQYEDSILIVQCQENGRQGRARNIGLQYVTAPYVSYVDADDWIECEMLQDMYKVAEETGVEVVACQAGRDRGDGRFCYMDQFGGTLNQVVQIEEISDRQMLLKQGIGAGVWGKLYQKSFLQREGLYFPENLVYEDNFFYQLLLFSVSSYVVLDKYYYHYFFNPDSTVSSADSPYQFDRLTVAVMTVEELKKRGYEEKYRDEMEAYFLSIYYVNTLHIIFTRFQTLPYDLLREMQEEVLRRYPSAGRDGAFQKLNEREQVMLSTLARVFSDREWEEIAESYRQYCRELEEAYREENGE